MQDLTLAWLVLVYWSSYIHFVDDTKFVALCSNM